MITDPLTLGITSYLDAFDLITIGPGAKSIRLSSTTPSTLSAHLATPKILTISHETTKTRRRSLFRLDYEGPFTVVATGNASLVQPPAAYLVTDQSLDGMQGDSNAAVLQLLSRILGFLSQNATGAPDHSFATQTKVVEWLRGEP
jgi:hypothetical protein